MYIPPHYQAPNDTICRNFIAQNPFGMLISNGENFPLVTHLPFVLDPSGQWLISHMAKANPQLSHSQNTLKCTVVFSGPHAYIGTQHYDKLKNVPTWNYIAIHAHGQLQIVENPKDSKQLMLDFISHVDSNFLPQWYKLDEKYKQKMYRGITLFKIKISELQGKFKLSQNKTEPEQKRIIDYLSVYAPDLAKYMKSTLFGI